MQNETNMWQDQPWVLISTSIPFVPPDDLPTASSTSGYKPLTGQLVCPAHYGKVTRKKGKKGQRACDLITSLSKTSLGKPLVTYSHAESTLARRGDIRIFWNCGVV
jgi:hypothetical protein